MLSDYRVPLKYFTDIRKINFPVKIDFRFKFHLEIEMKKLFESRKVLNGAATVDPDAKIIFTKAPFIQYEQQVLDKNFRQYLETIMVSKKVLRMGTQKSPPYKQHEINVGANSIEIDILGSNRQFDWLKFSLVYDKSHQHATIYNSYNFELSAKTIKYIKLSDFTEIYTLTNEKKFSIDNLTQKHLLYKQFVIWSCNGSIVAPPTDYINNPIYQELTHEEDYNEVKSDERVYLDLRASSGYSNEAKKLERNDLKNNVSIQLKAAATKKLRLRVWAYSISEYLYILSKNGLKLRHEDTQLIKMTKIY